ncbi:amino acid permease [Sphingomonas sp.]|uniref:APC family permease n=1 Tax=Sphingomonas sp. TaxID=28214 RepID=UPI00286E901B|nr:amino acid permease [Sphingomonas sp.]
MTDTAIEAPPARLLGFWTCTALVIGNTIGIGIFVLPAVLAPFGFNALLGWGVTVLGCIVLARVFARLAREYPGADGPYGYVRATLGETPAFLAIWCYWVSVWITNAALAIGVVGYLEAIFPGLAGIVPLPLIALGLLWLFLGINLFGVRTSGPVQIVMTVLKLLPMAAVIFFGLWMLVAEPAAFTRDLPPTPISLPLVMAASTIALFAMLGFESATVPASRVDDPGRTIPRATLVGTLVTAAIYIAISAIPMLLIPQAELAKSSAPFADLLSRELGAGSGRWLALFVVISGLGALNGWTLLVGELTRTMAANQVMPALFTRNNSRGAPVLALLMTSVLASIMILMNYSESLVDGFAFLSTMVTAANLPLYLFAALAVIILWRRGGRSPGLLALGLLGTAYAVFAFIGVGGEPFLWALALAAIGMLVYLLMRRHRARLPTAQPE